MTAYAPPPPVAVMDGRLSFDDQLTVTAATRHAGDVQKSLASLEEAIRGLPDGEAKASLTYRALRLHNQLARSGRALNAHFQTAMISPDSAGGDKDPPSQS